MLAELLSLLLSVAPSGKLKFPVPNPLCSKSIEGSHREFACFSAGRGTVLSSTRKRAETLSKHTSYAERKFKAVYGHDVDIYTVVDRDVKIEEQERATLLGRNVLTLLDDANSLSPNIVQEMSLSPEQGRDGVVAASSTHINRDDGNFVRHELGHMWLKGICSTRQATDYGTPAPDWIDEAAAILMEGPEQMERRRKEFAAAYLKAKSLCRNSF